ncbi:VOC family protein [Nocardiopsis lambiniae]|uniref:VOC family protein n=1 Tax=Nocardiopsis lambiniae TaxID=3075539 RepID=A0ABU2ME07_9ACTN|nr:VOC family protein [Nocardiopsis sp. DSM 44743]MDT0330917.1 VOC family protein [Nocardiopsis sp. DSM 44743]
MGTIEYEESDMSVNTVVHANFRGDARAALDFYQGVFGGDVAVITYGDAHNVTDESEAEQVMWGQVVSAAGFHLMAYDVPGHTPWNRGENAYFVSVRGDSVEEVTAYWKGLGEGGTVVQPFAESPWARAYGMVRDRFGLTWVLDVPRPHGAS